MHIIKNNAEYFLRKKKGRKEGTEQSKRVGLFVTGSSASGEAGVLLLCWEVKGWLVGHPGVTPGFHLWSWLSSVLCSFSLPGDRGTGSCWIHRAFPSPWSPGVPWCSSGVGSGRLFGCFHGVLAKRA